MSAIIKDVNELLGLISKRNKPKAMEIIERITTKAEEEFFDGVSSPKIDHHLIITTASKVVGVRVIDMLGKSRKRELSWARYLCYYYMREVQKETLYCIGQYFNRDHATVYHGCNQLKELLEFDKQMKEYYALFLKTLTKLQKKSNDKPSPTISQSAVHTSGAPTDVYVHRTVSN